jgi:hypothetical protein
MLSTWKLVSRVGLQPSAKASGTVMLRSCSTLSSQTDW